MPYRLDPTKRSCVQARRPSGRWERLKCHPDVRRAKAHLVRLGRAGPPEARAELADGQQLADLFPGVLEHLPIEPIEADKKPKKGFSTKTPPRSERRLGKGVNDRILDSQLRHRHWLLMVENGVAKEAALVYQEALREIERQLLAIAIREDAGANVGRIRRLRLEALYRRIDELVQIGGVEAEGLVTTALEQIAEREALYQANLLRAAIPSSISLDLAGPDLNIVQRMLSEPLGGAHYSERFAKNHGLATRAMQRSLAMSTALGESVPKASRRLMRAGEHLLYRHATLIARSEIGRVANGAAMEFHRANSDVVKGITIVETLDVRTCLLCIIQDGKFFAIGESTGSLPPYHPGCRGFVTPVTRSWEELGFSKRELPRTTRASMDGQIPSSISYPEWFATQSAGFEQQVLGPSRYRLWMAGEVKLDGMVKSGRILRVSELPVLP